MTDEKQVPDGYMINGRGNLIRIENIKTIDIIRDEEVKEMVSRAQLLNDQMILFKKEMLSKFNDFVDISFQEYQKKWGGEKGNISLTSYDQTMKVDFKIADVISFNEQLQVAKSYIEEYLQDKTKDVPEGIRTIALKTFKTDRNGNISTARVKEVLEYEITDERWLKAMDAIRDSMFVSGKRDYIRFYTRQDGSSKWSVIPLDLKSL